MVLNSRPAEHVGQSQLPEADVTVFVSGNNEQLDLSSNALTFTASNWNVPQEVTVSAVNDFVDEEMEFHTLSHTSASAQDIKYQGAGVIFSSGSNVTVQLKDNDVSAVTLSALNVFSRENGVNGTYSISLETHPSASRSELFMSNLDADVVITEQQVVTVVAVSDDAPEDLSNYIITHTASSEDPKYNSTARFWPTNDLGVTVVDPAGVSIVHHVVKPAEGGLQTIMLWCWTVL